MNDDYSFRRKDPLDPIVRQWRDPLQERPALPRAGFDHRGNPLCPPTFISTQGGSSFGTMHAGLSTMRTGNGTTYTVDVSRNVHDGAGRIIGQIDSLNRFTPR